MNTVDVPRVRVYGPPHEDLDLGEKGLKTLMDTRDNDQQLMANAFALMTAPVDPERFIMAVRVFDAAARMAMPSGESAVLPREAETTVALYRRKTDQAFNMAMEAVGRDLVRSGEKNPSAYLARIAMLPDLYGPAASVFSDYVENSARGVVLHEALMMGAARARIVADADGCGWDLGDVLDHAHRFAGRAPVEVRTTQ